MSLQCRAAEPAVAQPVEKMVKVLARKELDKKCCERAIVKPATDHILFISGAARSGTSYLSRVASKAFGYGMGPEGQFVLKFADKVRRYGNLSAPKNLRRLVTDISRDMMFAILREQYRVDVTVPAILERTAEPTYAAVVEAVFRAIADLRGLPRIGSKNPGAQNLPCIESLFRDRVKYLWIVRDGRDVFLSLQGMPWGRMSAYVAAKYWVDTDQKAREFAETIGEDRFLRIRYEDFRSDLSGTLDRMEDFQKILIPPETRARLLRENDERINYGKWKRSMSERDLYVFEAIAGDTLRRYGYETLFTEPAISAREALPYKLVELARLVRINVYHALNRHRPGDPRDDLRE